MVVMSKTHAQEPQARSHGEDVDPGTVARGFLEALSDEDVPAAMTWLDADVVYANRGLPTIRGRAAAARILRLLDRPAIGFETCIHVLAVDGPTVLTERTDLHRFGPLVVQFWVCGRYDVRAGRLTLLREYFDFLDIFKGTVRGVLALAIPALSPPRPAPGSTPGRARHERSPPV